MKKTVLYLLGIACSFNAFSVTVTRKISKSVIEKNESINVVVTISKGDISGVGKLVEIIPEGFSPAVVNKSGGRAKVSDDGELKIQWLALPANAEFVIEYRLLHLGTTAGPAKIGGTFTYLVDNSQKKYSLEETTITVGTGGSKSPSIATKKAVKKKPVAKIVIEKEVVAATPAPVKEEVVTKPVIKEESIASGTVVYSVQLGAYSNEKSMTLFTGLPDVHLKRVNGLYKYYSGLLNSEAEARKLIIQAENKGFEGAFLVVEK